MRLKTTVNEQGQIYIPKKERDKIAFCTKSVDYLSDARGILIIPSTASANEVVKIAKAIVRQAEHEEQIEKTEVLA